MIVSRCSSFVRQATAPASKRASTSRRLAEAVRQITATSGQAARRRPRRLDAVERRQPEVHHDDVRIELETEVGDLRPVPHGADHVDVRAQPEQKLERLSEDVVVLDEGYTNRRGGHARTLGSYSADTKSG